MKKVLVTGANGFVGRGLMESLIRRTDVSVTAAVRTHSNLPEANVEQIDGLSVGPTTTWQLALRGATHVVHLAGLTTETEQSRRAGFTYWTVNVEGTLNLARQAAATGVERFIFISSAKVNGEWTPAGQPFTYSQNPNPQNPYGVSKRDAEQGLYRIANQTGMAVVIIRPPLVYGPRVIGNFHSMIAWVAKGYPLPLGAVHNLRSLVALDNLVDLIQICIDHPAAANETFLVSDGHDVSTVDLLRNLGLALGRPARLLPVPVWLIGGAAAVLGKNAFARRLCGNLQVDISHTRNTLGWRPPTSMDDALKRTAEDFLASRSGNSKR